MLVWFSIRFSSLPATACPPAPMHAHMRDVTQAIQRPLFCLNGVGQWVGLLKVEVFQFKLKCNRIKSIWGEQREMVTKKLPWSSESDDTDRALVYSSLDVQRSCRILITSRDARTRCYDNYPTHWKLLHCNKENQSSRGEGDPSPY